MLGSQQQQRHRKREHRGWFRGYNPVLSFATKQHCCLMCNTFFFFPKVEKSHCSRGGFTDSTDTLHTICVGFFFFFFFFFLWQPLFCRCRGKESHASKKKSKEDAQLKGRIQAWAASSALQTQINGIKQHGEHV